MKKILVCEDEQVIREFVVINLKRAGYEAYEAENGEQALEIYEREGGKLPVSVIDKPIDCRMASTIRHNRARGSHDVDLMSNIISELHELGRSDAWISRHLGMDKDEILRLKQITGLTALFKEVEFGRAWKAIENDLQDEWEEVEK